MVLVAGGARRSRERAQNQFAHGAWCKRGCVTVPIDGALHHCSTIGNITTTNPRYSGRSGAHQLRVIRTGRGFGVGVATCISRSLCLSDDNGGTWRMHVPNITNQVSPTPLASQPITTAFRSPTATTAANNSGDAIHMGVDSAGASSGLWRSLIVARQRQVVGGYARKVSWASHDLLHSTVNHHHQHQLDKDPQNHGIRREEFCCSVKCGRRSDFCKSPKTTFPSPCYKPAPLRAPSVFWQPRICRRFPNEGKGRTTSWVFSQTRGNEWGVWCYLPGRWGYVEIKPLPIGLPHEEDRANFGTLSTMATAQ